MSGFNASGLVYLNLQKEKACHAKIYSYMSGKATAY